jgi:hypothetical protein
MAGSSAGEQQQQQQADQPPSLSLNDVSDDSLHDVLPLFGVPGSSSDRDNMLTPTTTTTTTADDSPGRRRMRQKRSAGLLAESGSDADDEGSYGLLRGLPAPPAVQRKGLRGAPGMPPDFALSPVATPSFLGSSGRTLSAELRAAKAAAECGSARPDGASPTPPPPDVQAKVQLFRKRRRAELVRRVTEATLVATLGGIVLCGDAARQRAMHVHRGIVSEADAPPPCSA